MKRIRIVGGAALIAFGMSLLVVAASAEDNHVVATVGSHRITQQEVDSKIKSQITSIESQLYEVRRRAVESMADDYLIEQAAAKQHLSTSEYLKREIDDKVPPPSDSDLQKAYDQHKAQIKQPLDKAKPMLISFLKRQETQQRREDLLAHLREGQPVKIMLKAPRFEVRSSGHPSLGPHNAPVTIVEFGDFQCPFCKKVEDTLREIQTKYGDKVRLVYMDFPLQFHSHAMDAAVGARCAGEQDKFWPFHDALFSNQSKLDPADLKAEAARLGLDNSKFESCLDSKKPEAGIRADMAYGQTLGVQGTPAFFINGRSLSGARPIGDFEEIIKEELTTAPKKPAEGDKTASASP